MRTTRILWALIILALLSTSCESGPRVRMAPGYEQTDTPVRAQADMMGTPMPTQISPTPTIVPLTLDNQPYTLPSQTLSFYPPQRWELVSESDGYVKFSRKDGVAWFEGAVESSGYELSNESYARYADNMLASLYGDTVDYQLLSREDLPGKITVISSLKKGDLTWYTMDFFLRRAQAMYLLSFHAYESVWDTYKDSFTEIIESVSTQTGYLKDKTTKEDGSPLSDEEIKKHPLYRFRKPYTAPGSAYQIKVPLGWGAARDEGTYADGVAETISSPDDEAHVDMIVLDGALRISEELDIGQVSIGVLKERFGQDLRITADEVLTDDRIRVDWQVDKTGKKGYTFFWLNQNDLNILSYWRSGDHEGTYQPLLFWIGNTLSFLKENNPQ